MCGISGIISAAGDALATVRRMTAPIAHRGPDDEGYWADDDAGVAFGHRRLSIVDLSPSGRQPMHSACGRFVICFNGEIYNHRDIRRQLDDSGATPANGWRGHSDTETFLQAIAAWGLERALEESAGMFAFALWDGASRTLRLVRDRFGEKPLYYGWVGRDFVFASELKAIRAHPRFDNGIDRRALRLFASRTYIPAPLSIYEGLYKLPPGCILTVPAASASSSMTGPPSEGSRANGATLERYWSYREQLEAGLADPITSEAEALDRLEQALATAIQGQSIADVPVGAFLSGGIDSSTVVALYQKYSSIPVRTYSIGFEEAGYNEAEDARRVAAHLGTVHNEHYVTVAEARSVIPSLPSMYDEPFADSSQIPTYLVSRFAREEVTVAITGDGGDELFAGYNRHFAAPRLWDRLRRVPKPLRAVSGSVLGRLPSSLWSGAAGMLPGRRQPHFGSKVQKAFRVAASADAFDDVYRSFLDEWSFEQSPVRGGDGDDMPIELDLFTGAPDSLRTMYCDAVGYLPDDILCKVDRASMAVSLETRVPFLDHRVAALAARIPLDMKVREGKGKHIVRQLLYRHVPRELIDRPKAGFGVPVGEWIKGPLRPWAEDLLDRGRMASEGWFDPAIVHRRWLGHLSGARDSTPAIWAVLMFQAWLRAQPERFQEAA